MFRAPVLARLIYVGYTVMNPSATSAVKYDDFPVKLMLYPSLLFLILGMFFGVYIAFNAFVWPDYFSGQYMHFGVVRPVHVTHVTLLWLLSCNVALFYYFVPRLCGVPLWNSTLAIYSAGLWWFSLILGNYSYPLGTNFGWEYAELPVWVSFFPH